MYVYIYLHWLRILLNNGIVLYLQFVGQYLFRFYCMFIIMICWTKENGENMNKNMNKKN